MRIPRSFVNDILATFAGMALVWGSVPLQVHAQEATRPFVGGLQALVAANHPQAAAAGLQILSGGGNAVDAAIATAAALGVVEPYVSGAGGDGFMLVYWAATGEVHLLNLSGRAPAELSAHHFPEGFPERGPLVVLVPGAVAGWEAARMAFGTLSPAALLAPAIHLAEEGYPATRFAAAQHGNATFLREWDGAGMEAWWRQEVAPHAGEIIRNPKLARTYKTLAAEGFEAFYRGEIASEIVASVRRHGGVLNLADLAGFSVAWEEPLSTTYRGYRVHTPRPNSSGGLAVPQILNLLEGFDLAGMGENSADYFHLLIEAVKLAAADRAKWSGDPDFLKVEIPYARLLSKDYASMQRKRLRMDQAGFVPTAGVSQSGTTHLTVVDQDGNMVSLTATVGSAWGSGFVAGETGVLLSNGVRWFELDPESPAFLEGGKRTRWNMSPVIITRDGNPVGALGTPGGTGIWQTLPQVITKLVDFGLDIQSAIESPRFRWDVGGLRVHVESRVPDEVILDLLDRGHDVGVFPAWTPRVGGVNGVMVAPHTGLMMGGADPRRDGYVMGW
jgi:gamma-glutamyltranspeptidase